MREKPSNISYPKEITIKELNISLLDGPHV